MKHRHWIVMAALALAPLTIATPTMAAGPISAEMASSTRQMLNSSKVVEDVRWNRRRHCNWHRGRRVCSWRRVWVPGIGIYVGPRNRHHRHRHRHRRH